MAKIDPKPTLRVRTPSGWQVREDGPCWRQPATAYLSLCPPLQRSQGWGSHLKAPVD